MSNKMAAGSARTRRIPPALKVTAPSPEPLPHTPGTTPTSTGQTRGTQTSPPKGMSQTTRTRPSSRPTAGRARPSYTSKRDSLDSLLPSPWEPEHGKGGEDGQEGHGALGLLGVGREDKERLFLERRKGCRERIFGAPTVPLRPPQSPMDTGTPYPSPVNSGFRSLPGEGTGLTRIICGESGVPKRIVQCRTPESSTRKRATIKLEDEEEALTQTPTEKTQSSLKSSENGLLSPYWTPGALPVVDEATKGASTSAPHHATAYPTPESTPPREGKPLPPEPEEQKHRLDDLSLRGLIAACAQAVDDQIQVRSREKRKLVRCLRSPID